MISVDEILKSISNKKLMTTSDFLEEFSKRYTVKDISSEETKDFREGLHIGFNYALAMIKEELGDDIWKNKKTDKLIVQYYSSLIYLNAIK